MYGMFLLFCSVCVVYCRCIVLAAVFMVYLDRVYVPFPTGCRKKKGSPRVMKLPVLQMFPVRYFSNLYMYMFLFCLI